LGSAAIACGDRFSADKRVDGGSIHSRDASANDGSPFSRGGAASNTGGSRNASGGSHADSGGSENGGGAPVGGNGGIAGSGARGGASGNPDSGGAGGNAGAATGGNAGMGAGGTGAGGRGAGGTAGAGSGGTGTGGRGAGGRAGAGSGGAASGGMAGGGTGGAMCQNGDPKCSDGTCSRLSWNFESGLVDGLVRLTSPHPLAVGVFDGTSALGIDVDQLNMLPGVSFALTICNSGSVDLRSKTLSFRVYFEGTPVSAGNFYVQASCPSPSQQSAFLGQIGAGSGAWTPYSAPLSMSAFSSGTTTITIEAGSLGAGFTGTIWFDDFSVR
jgi:hypothetical protein